VLLVLGNDERIIFMLLTFSGMALSQEHIPAKERIPECWRILFIESSTGRQFTVHSPLSVSPEHMQVLADYTLEAFAIEKITYTKRDGRAGEFTKLSAGLIAGKVRK